MGRDQEIGSRGFTLLELIVVLLVLALAVALSAPAVGRGTEGLRVRAEVAGFSATLRHAREQAITSRKAHVVAVDPAEHRMTIAVDGSDVRQTRALPARLRVEASPPPALSVRFEPPGHSTGGDFRLSSGEVSYRVTVDPATGRVRAKRE